MRTLHLLSLAAALAIPVVSYAGPITVVNGNFDTAPQGGLNTPYFTGDYSMNQGVPGWVASGNVGQISPTTYLFYNGQYSGLIAYSNGGSLTQTVGATVVEGVLYTLTVDVGQRLDGYPALGTVDLLINGVQYSATGTYPAPGDFSPYTVSYLGTSADAGKSITIELAAPGAQGDFDNVALTATTPEPSSFILLGTALIGCTLVARRKLAL